MVIEHYERLLIVFVIVLLLISLTPINAQNGVCKVPEVDILFVLDGTQDVGTVNFAKVKDYVHQFITKLDVGLQKSRAGLVQFTPTARPEFYPLNYLSNSLVQKAINEVPYKPCIGDRNVCHGASKDVSSLNYVAQFGMSPASGNRPRIPDALVVLTGDGYRPTAYRVNETLFQPLSALYVFVIKIGGTDQRLDLSIPFATKNVEMYAPNYDRLPELIEPLCQDMKKYIEGTNQVSSTDTTVAQASASLGWVPFLLLFILVILLLILIGWLLCKSQKENRELQSQKQVLTDFDGEQQWASTRTGSGKSVQVNAGNDGRLYTGPHQVMMSNKGQGMKQTSGSSFTTDGTTLTDFDLDDDAVQVHNRTDNQGLRHRRHHGDGDGTHRHRHHRHKHNRSRTMDNGQLNSEWQRTGSRGSLNRSNSHPNNQQSEKTSYLNGGYEQSEYELARQRDLHKRQTPRPTNENGRLNSSTTVNMGGGKASYDRKDNGQNGKTSDYSSEHSRDRDIEMEDTFIKTSVNDDNAELKGKEMANARNDGEQDASSLFGEELPIRSAMGYHAGNAAGHHSRITKYDGSRMDQAENVHPSRRLPPVDLLLMVDNSGSIGMVNFQKAKDFLGVLIDNVNLGPGKSRVACVTFSTEPDLYFSFDRFFTPDSVKAALKRIPYKGGQTFLGRALQFASGILAQEKSVYMANSTASPKKVKRSKKDKKSKQDKDALDNQLQDHVALSPRPQANVLGKRLQVVIVVTDGSSEDSIDNASKIIHQKIGARVAAVGYRTFRKDKLKEISGYEGSTFLLHDKEAVCNWLLKQQSIWLEVHGYDPLVYGNLPLIFD